MIRKLRLKNFKSFKDQEIELKNLNVLVGPNASGKSNLIDALMFLSELANAGVREVLERRGGFEKVAFKGTEREIELSCNFDLEGYPSSYHISFTRWGIEREELAVGETTIIKGKKGEGKCLPDGKEEGHYAVGRWQTCLYIYGREETHTLLGRAYRFLISFRSYQFIPSEIRETSVVRGELELERSGANLARVLHTLHSQQEEVFQRIEDLLRQGIPEIERLRTPLVEGKSETYIAVREKGFEADRHQISDGTLKLLAFITAVSMPEPALVCFEEPENFIHARLLKLLVEILKKSEKQVILSTHHPYLVDFVEPEEILIVEKEEGESKVYRIEEPNELRRRLEELELRLGEYYYSGALGGVP